MKSPHKNQLFVVLFIQHNRICLGSRLVAVLFVYYLPLHLVICQLFWKWAMFSSHISSEPQIVGQSKPTMEIDAKITAMWWWATGGVCRLCFLLRGSHMITETQLISNKQSSRTHVRCFASIDAIVRCTLPQLLDVCGLIRCDFKNRTKHVWTVRDRQAAEHVSGGSRRNGSPYLGHGWCRYWEGTAWSRLPWCDDDGMVAFSVGRGKERATREVGEVSELFTKQKQARKIWHGFLSDSGCSNKPKHCPKHGFTSFYKGRQRKIKIHSS